MVLGAQKVKYCEESEFRKECFEYFEIYYKKMAMKAPLVLPSAVPTKFKGVIDTMSRWCESAAKGNYLKGFVLHSFLIKHLYFKICNDELKDPCGKFNIEDFPSTPTITVYNPKEKILFLIRVAESEDVENEIKLCGTELKMLMLLIGDELQNTGIKVIPLVVTDKESKCTGCKSYLILRKEVENIDLFTRWCEQKSVDFDIAPTDHFDESKAKNIFAKFVSCMGATEVNAVFPIFTTEKDKQMKGALLLLTPEQINILNSEDKHIIIEGPYGSGKSIIGRTKAKMIADNLPEDELLYYISYDSRSALLNEIQRNNAKIKIYPDEEEQKGTKLSDMIMDILNRNGIGSQRNENNCKNQKKINLIIDEYDGEKLDQLEAIKLNGIIYMEYKKIFQDTVILLIAQSMKKERWANNKSIDTNRFDLLEQMQRKRLCLVMRNSIQIYNLLEVTKKILESIATRYDLQEKKKSNTNNNEKGMPRERSAKSFSNRIEFSETAMKSSKSQFGASDLELDEAFDYAGTPTADNGEIENRFKYEEATNIGHGGESKLPVLFELYRYDKEFDKILSLAAVFENLQLASSTANSKHVLLHFNINNEIPRQALKLLDLKHDTKVTSKVTNSYVDFKNDSSRKYIFVGNFRTFRGLEHPRITIIVDRDIYSLQHYLVECIARCTTYLNVVLLGTNKSLKIITQRWKEGICGKPLVERRRIILKKGGKQSKDGDTQEFEGITIDIFSQEYKKLKQAFNGYLFQRNEGEDIVSKQEAKIAVQR